jgi:preprotein translocase SecF subunit
MRFFRNTKIDFMKIRRICITISLSMILVSLVSLVVHGGPHFSVDFRGGTFLQIRFKHKVDPQHSLFVPIDKVRTVFNNFGFGESEIKHYGALETENDTTFQDIAARLDETENTDTLVAQIIAGLNTAFPDYNVWEVRRETVGPKIGKELVWAAILSILVAMLLILVYVMWRFEFRFGVGAVVALFHDVIITLGIFSLMNLEISIAIVAALLTIIGYSLNDTIVVYDRIREDLKTYRRSIHDYGAIINQSINETLSRTIITSGTTLMVVVVLYFFGGEVIHDFAFALICGIIIGTYSSIYIASPILVEWENRKQSKIPVRK